jgi:purine-nucleoside phosphorylase
MEGLYERVMEAIKSLSDRISLRPEVGLVLGSGLGALSDSLETIDTISYESIPHFPTPTAPGHSGNLLIGRLSGCPLAVLQGRFHFYEGHSTKEITFPIRVLAGLQAQTLIVTNAAGGLNPLFAPGDLMAVDDHLHLIPENPLCGLTDDRLGDRFPDMSRAYDPDLLHTAESVALEHSLSLHKGVYVGVPGPSLETPAETRLLRTMGADAVGMSTTSEVIVARSLGMRVLGLSVISNVNRPDCMAPILLEDILRVSSETTPRLMKLIEGVLKRMSSD